MDGAEILSIRRDVVSLYIFTDCIMGSVLNNSSIWNHCLAFTIPFLISIWNHCYVFTNRQSKTALKLTILISIAKFYVPIKNLFPLCTICQSLFWPVGSSSSRDKNFKAFSILRRNRYINCEPRTLHKFKKPLQKCDYIFA